MRCLAGLCLFPHLFIPGRRRCFARGLGITVLVCTRCITTSLNANNFESHRQQIMLGSPRFLILFQTSHLVAYDDDQSNFTQRLGDH
jgi:hypothetical protein